MTYSLKAVDDYAAFEIDPGNGARSMRPSQLGLRDADELRFHDRCDRCPRGNATEGAVTLTLTDSDEEAPVFTSVESVTVDENVAADTVLYTPTRDR